FINVGTGTGASGIVNMASNNNRLANGEVTSVTVTGAGSGYVAPVSVTFAPAVPAGGTTATGTAILGSGSTVTGVVMTNPGAGYTAAPTTVTFTGSGGAGSGATGTAVFSPVAPITLNGGGLQFLGNMTTSLGAITLGAGNSTIVSNPVTSSAI